MLNNTTTNDSKVATPIPPLDLSGLQALPPETFPAVATPKERSFLDIIGEVWRGERSLAETWWVWKVLIGNLGIGVGLAFVTGLITGLSHSAIPIYLFLPICVTYDVWSLVGCFRSAWARQGFWGWVVIILCVVNVITALASIPDWAHLISLYR